MLADQNDRPGGDEQYIAATNTSDLTLDPDHLCAADHLIAAALGGNRMGDALNHLRSEWDTVHKPPKWTDDDVAARALLVPKHKGKPDLKRARAQIIVEYAAALRSVYMHTVGRALCMQILSEWARLRSVDPDLLSPALYHYLNPLCPVCDGRGKLRHPDAPVLGKDCHHCAGAGKWPRPLGAERVESFLKGCVGKAKRNRGNMLHWEIDLVDLADRKESERRPAAEDERGAAAVAEVARRAMGAP